LAISPGKAILVAVISLVIHQIEGNVVTPMVMARAVKLHPAAVVVGVIAVEQLFGFVGLFVAVPILAMIKILIEELWDQPARVEPGPARRRSHRRATHARQPGCHLAIAGARRLMRAVA
jgi:predicted PurR-regulated permease PerM